MQGNLPVPRRLLIWIIEGEGPLCFSAEASANLDYRRGRTSVLA